MALGRKPGRRVQGGWSQLLTDLDDYLQPATTRACRTHTNDANITVTDDWPEQVPIGNAQLRVIEGHLRQELDNPFGALP